MLQRFVSAAAIAGIAIVCGALALLLFLPAASVQRSYPLVLLWCFVPAAWGLWAMLAPRSFVPHRLPIWGALLGLIAGALAAFALNLPSQILGQAVRPARRGVAAAVIVVFYYVLWMLVRAVYRALSPVDSAAPKSYTTTA